LAVTGWLLYLVSFFLPSLGFRGVFGPVTYGWEIVSTELLGNDRSAIYRSFWGLAALTLNAPILMSPLAVFGRQSRMWKVFPHVMLVVTLLTNALALLSVFYDGDGVILLLGGYLWCISYVLITCALYLNRRIRMLTNQG
jgi:hypothetical protein